MAGALPYFAGNTVACRRARGTLSSRRPLFSRRHMVSAVSTANKVEYWDSINADIRTYLKEAVRVRPPVVVYEPMYHLTFTAPETSAPALCVAACELVGGSRDQAMAAASAIHLMHAAAFTHENLPSTGRARPLFRPMIDHKFGPNVELLISDGMIPFGMELLAKSDNPAQSNSDRILGAIMEISHAMGSQGVIEGQYNELHQSEQSDDNEPIREAWVEQVVKKKEGVLYGCAGACGAILGGGSEEEREKLRLFGVYVGMTQGISNKIEKGQQWPWEELKELRNLALRELKDFNQEKVRIISGLFMDKLV